MNKDIILVGGGGHCKSVIDTVEMGGYNILGILDISERIGDRVLSTSVIGDDNDIFKFVGKASFLITVGFIKNPAIRIKLFDKVKSAGGEIATVIAPTAYVSKYAIVGEGTIIMHNALINAEANIGKNCIINTAAIIEHESFIGDQTHISTGTIINGGCTVGERVFIGSQSVSSQGIHITDDVIISANSFIKNNITDKGIYENSPLSKRK